MSGYPGSGSIEDGGNFGDESPPGYTPYGGGGGGGGSPSGGSGSSGGNTSARPFLWAATAAGLLGTIFSGLSTSDFIAHLDRQVHSIHCSLNPLANAQFTESGCKTVMMSPYSSVLRDSMWGGMPISLLSLAVFFYLVARAASFAVRDGTTKRETGYLLLAWCLPVLTSVIYGGIAASQIGAFCTLCIGIYVTSAVGFLTAAIAHSKAPAGPGGNGQQWAMWFGVGVAYVAVIALLYVMFAPTDDNPAEGCGTLVKREDKSGIILDLGGKKGGADALAIIDPLCPACKGFDKRMQAGGLYDKLEVDAVLFPLDAACNWMLKESLHPGACAVSEAMLCDKDHAVDILDWAFEHQEKLTEIARADQPRRNAINKKILSKFPQVKGCLGTNKIKNKVTKSLQFAVANALPVLTPQLFIDGQRLCDEDTDLGLEFTVAEMIKGGKPGKRRGR